MTEKRNVYYKNNKAKTYIFLLVRKKMTPFVNKCCQTKNYFFFLNKTHNIREKKNFFCKRGNYEEQEKYIKKN